MTKTECVRGHPTGPGDRTPRGTCRACKRIDGLARYQRIKPPPKPLSPTCRRGHPYVADNLHLAPDGERVCRTCNRERYHAKRAAEGPRERKSREHLRRPLADRFWPKVDKSGDCWLWRGAVTRSGYGAIGAGGKGGKMLPAHRASLMLSGVALTAADLACHRCDVKLCVRPAHLYVGTWSTNNHDTSTRNPRSHLRHPDTGAHISAGLRVYQDARRSA
jgi:hypothetical protein